MAAFAVAVALPLAMFGQDAPDAAGDGGEANPMGVTGIYSGNIATGCSYDPYTRNALRVIDDIVVPGSVGAYPLKWTRYNNSRTKIGANGGWTFSYQYWCSATKLTFPDGRVIEDSGETASSGGMEEWSEQDPTDPAQDILHLPDGGKIILRYFDYRLPTKIIDPYGHETLIEHDTQANGYRMTKITEPGGRYLKINWESDSTTITQMPASVSAYTGPAGSANDQLIETVTYTWGTMSPNQGGSYRQLTHVAYSDGTAADYTNNFNDGSVKKVILTTAQDVRHNGPMRQITYQHISSGGGGMVAEKKMSGEVVSTLQYDSGQQRTELRGDGATRHFIYSDSAHGGGGAYGKLTDYTDFQNHHTIIDYEPTEISPWYGFVKKVTDPNGHSTSYTRQNSSWGITRITHDVDGSHSDQTFWPNNSQTQPYYLASRTDELGHTTTYARNDPANPQDDPLNPNSIKQKNYPDGSWETFTYNGFGEVVTHSRTKTLSPLVLETESFTYDTRGLKTKYTDPLLKETTYSYYAPGDAEFPAWADRLKTVTRPANASGQVQTETFEYDKKFVNGVETATPCAGRGLITKVKRTDGSTIMTTHNPWGDVLTATDELGHMTTNTYDDYGRVITTTTFPEYLGDPVNHTTILDYKPDGQTNSYVTTSKLPWLVTLPSGKKTKTVYDFNWRKTQVQVGFNTLEQANTVFYYDTYAGYTSIGNLLATKEPQNTGTSYVTRYHYDVRDRQDQVTDALGTSLGDPNHTTSFTFDHHGNKTSETHPNTPQGALFIEYDGYDLMNRLTHKKVHRDATHIDETSMTYDAAGNLQTTTDENYHTYTYAYDVMNRRTSMIYPDTSKHEDTAYDDAGNIKTYTNRSGKIQTFGYDNRNRQTSFYWNDNNVTPAQSMAYDAASRPTQMVRWYASRTGSYYCTINLAYYDDNRLRSEEEWTDAFSDNVHRTITYTYDADGNRATVLYPSGTAFNYTYTSRNQPYEIKPGLSGGAAIVSYTYDLSGNIATRALENNTTSAYTVDRLNRGTTIVHNLAVAPAKQFDYAYNNLSDITLVKRDSGNGDGFFYDRTQQILAFQQNATVDINAGTISGGQTTSLEFDGCGNRTKLNGTSMATPNNMNQPTDTGMGHDNNGDLQTYDGWNFAYDAQNRIVSATKGSTSATFAYDAKNRQIARSINGVVTFSVWDNWELVEEYTTGNVVTAKYLQGAHGPVKSLLNNVYYYQDSLGSTSHVADATGHLLEYYKYDLYGKPTLWAPNNPQPLSASNWGVNDLFSGERWIPALGLYDLRNRYYSPDLGRFLQPDPIGFNGDASNLYRYCGNDWANRVDPMGLQAAPGDNREQMRQPDNGVAEYLAQGELRFEVYAPTANAVDRSGGNSTYALGGGSTLHVENSIWRSGMSFSIGEVSGSQKEDRQITVDCNKDSSGTLRLMEGDKTLLKGNVVVGGKDHPTPTGKFHASKWEKDHTSKLYGNNANTPWSKSALGRNAFGPYQLHIKELESRGIYIHGTMGPSWFPSPMLNRFLSPTSHGCVRMSNRDIISLHNLLPNPAGIPITINSH